MSAVLVRAMTLALLLFAGASHAAAQRVPYPDAREAEVLFLGPRPLALSARLGERERSLRVDLDELAAGARRHFWSGAFQGAVGAGFVTAGALVHDDYARALLISIGASTLAQGLVQLLLVPNATPDASHYRALPMITAEQVRERIGFGERALARLARGGRRTRIVQGTITMCAASAYVPLLWWLARRADAGHHFGDSSLDYVGLALSVISFGSGLATALVESDAEQRYGNYQRMRARFEQTAPLELEQLSRRGSLRLALAADRLQVGARFGF